METPIINLFELAYKEENPDILITTIEYFINGQLISKATEKPMETEELAAELETVSKKRKNTLLSNLYLSLMAMDDKEFIERFGALDPANFLTFIWLFDESEYLALIQKLVSDEISEKQFAADKKQITGPAQKAMAMLELNKAFAMREIRRGNLTEEEYNAEIKRMIQENQTISKMADLAQENGATRDQAINAAMDYIFESNGEDPNSQQAEIIRKYLFGGSDNGNDERRD